MYLCKYKNIFGKENEGAHSIRFFNVAIVDLLLTLLAGAIISYFTRINLILMWIMLILLGIIVHRIFCVNTTINRLIFGQV
jgi:hypothetical protein